MNHRDSVITAMKMFSDGYPGKFTVGNKVATWERVLVDIDPAVIPVAALHLIAIRKDWPPDVATLREQCVIMSHGRLQDPTGSEAWERIRKKIGEAKGCENPTKLSDDEKKALDQTASLYDLRHGIGDSISFARDKFTKAYDAIVSKRRLECLALPEVRSFVAGRAPALPAPESKALPEHEEPEYLEPDQVSELCDELLETLGY